MDDIIESAYLLALSEDTEVSSVGCAKLHELADKDWYVAVIYLIDVIGRQDRSDFAQLDALLLKARQLQPSLIKGRDLHLAGARGFFDGRLGLSRLEAMKYLVRACEQGERDAYWDLYEMTRHENPLDVDRGRALTFARENFCPQALVEFAELRPDSQGDLALRCALELGSIRAKEILDSGAL